MKGIAQMQKYIKYNTINQGNEICQYDLYNDKILLHTIAKDIKQHAQMKTVMKMIT